MLCKRKKVINAEIKVIFMDPFDISNCSSSSNKHGKFLCSFCFRRKDTCWHLFLGVRKLFISSYLDKFLSIEESIILNGAYHLLCKPLVLE